MVIVEQVYRALVAARYTGGQSAADVAAACAQITQLTGNQWTVQSDDGETLVLRETSPSGHFADWPVLAGQVVVIDPAAGIVDRLPVDKFLLRYRRASVVAEDVLVAGLNSPAWLTALRNKLGLPLAAK
jgi:hypothetical protein